jgi:flagellar basal-body rod protein FlgG
MTAQQLNLDNIANNLANSSTAGFRRRRLQFQDMIYQNFVMPGSAATQQTTMAAGLQIGLGTRTSASEIIQFQGDFNSTGNPLDLSVSGQGFFQVSLPTGDIAYTRSGEFHLDAQENLVTADGNPLQPGITIPPGATSVTIGADGTVSVTQPGQTAAQQVGQIQLGLFPNPGGLNSVGKNLFLATTASGDPIIGSPGGTEGLGTIEQGPIHNGRFADNWELSTARSAELVRLLITKYGFAAERLSAAGYAEIHPVASNDSPETRAQNRRVDIVVLGRFVPESNAPTPTNQLGTRPVLTNER